MMDIEAPNIFRAGHATESTCGGAMLGRLGRELADVYGDVADTPMPPHLRCLIEQLEAALDARAESGPDGE